MKRIPLSKEIEKIVFKETLGVFPDKSVKNIVKSITKLIANNYRRRVKK